MANQHGGRRYVVDRFEGKVAVLEGDEGMIEVAGRALPEGCKEGDVLLVLERSGAEPERWRFCVDQEATNQSRAEAAKILDELRDRDPGGDISL